MGFELLRELIHTTILTGRIEGQEPLSLLLIAPPERGKTSIVLEKVSESVVALSDITGRGLQEICKHHPNVSHLILTDMITVMAHKQSVSRYTISILNAITEEGLQGIAFPGQVEVFGKNGRRAIIACLTPELASDNRCWWARTGFTSRMLPFNYEHSKELTLRIKEHIENNHETIKPSRAPDELILLVPAKPVPVKIPKERMKEIRLLADIKATQLNEIGYRRLKQYIALAQGHALSRLTSFDSGATVLPEDTCFIANITRYVSYTEGLAL